LVGYGKPLVRLVGSVQPPMSCDSLGIQICL